MVAYKPVFSVITTTLITFTAAQSDALASLSALISYEDAAISSLSGAVATNPLYTPYSSAFAEFTSEWGVATQELAGVTAALATNPAESSAIASYLSRVGPLFSSITAHPFTLPTDSAGLSSAFASESRALASFSQSLASSATAAASSAAASTNAAPGLVGVQFGLMSAAAVGVLALAVCL